MKRDLLPSALPASATASLTHGWGAALLALGAVLTTILVAYAQTGAEMVAIWYRSVTFTHGFVVAPISAWLIWRKRETLRTMEPRPSLIVLPLIAVAGVAWLVAQLGAVNAIGQAAFVAMLILAVPAVLGMDVARAILFPLGFLFFAVPIGDFLLPTLMDWTADFAVWALRATGVPVYREGLLLHLPTGSWSVIEACSGVRYLIASLMVGTLFAYLNFRAHSRRWVFVGVAAAVPIVANWVRAYLIVLLGHVSNNRLAVGVDHLIYGWVFFGVVMLVMFWIGARWQEAAAAVPVPQPPRASRLTSVVPAARFWSVAIATASIALASPVADVVMQIPERAASVQLDFQAPHGWQKAVDQSGFLPHFELPSAFANEAWRRDGSTTSLYVAYYRNQTAERKLVSSENVLVTGEHSPWARTTRRERDVEFPAGTYRVAETRLRAPDGRLFVAWRWYWIDGVVTASDIRAKATIAWSRLVHRKDDSAAIVIMAEDGNGQRAVETLQRFTRDAWPNIAESLRRAGAT